MVAWSTLNCTWAQNGPALPSIEDYVKNKEAHAGFFPFYYDRATGHLTLQVDRWEEEFLYVNSLAAGLGSDPLHRQVVVEKLRIPDRFGRARVTRSACDQDRGERGQPSVATLPPALAIDHLADLTEQEIGEMVGNAPPSWSSGGQLLLAPPKAPFASS